MTTYSKEQVISDGFIPPVKLSGFWKFLLSVMLVAGIYGLIMSLAKGEAAFGVSDQVPWGILLSTYIFFVAITSGLCLISSLGHVFEIEKYNVLGVRALLLAVVTLVIGFMVIAIELGHPFRLLLYALISPNFMSPIWWMGALYGLYLVVILFELWYLIKHDHKKSRFWGILGFSLAIIAHSNLGAVFAMLIARPYWGGPFMPIYFILLALISGAAIITIVFYLMHKSENNVRFETLIRSLGTLMISLLVINAFFIAWNLLTGLYGKAPGKYEAAMSLLSGPLSFNFWFFEVLIGMLLPIILILFFSRNSIKNLFFAAILVILGIFFMRYDLLIAGQLVPLEVIKTTFSGYHYYRPTLVEIGVVLGALALIPIGYIAGINIINKLQARFSHNASFTATSGTANYQIAAKSKV